MQNNSFLLMKHLKMKEVYHVYMVILIKIIEQKKVVFIKYKRYIILPVLTIDGFIVADIGPLQ